MAAESDLQGLVSTLTAGDEEAAEAAFSALKQLAAAGQAEAVFAQALILLGSAQADQRWWGVRLLAELPGCAAQPWLLQALQDPEAAVRQCAALGLRLHPAEENIPPLVAALSDPDPLVVSLAEDALEAVGAAAVPALLEAWEKGPPPVRLAAVRTLAAIGDPRAIPALYAALDEDSALMEYFASAGLERMGIGMVFFKPD